MVSPAIKVWTKPLAIRQEVRSELVRRFGQVPQEYVDVAEGWEDLEFEVRGQYFRIWGGLRAIEFHGAYPFAEFLPGSIPIGDDGGGRFLVYFDGARGRGIYRGEFGVMDPSEARWVAGSLTDILEHPEAMEWEWRQG